MSRERMTSAKAREWAEHETLSSARVGLRRAAIALAEWEAEDAARRKAPSLKYEWWVLDSMGVVWEAEDRADALSQLGSVDIDDPSGAPHRAVRLAVVEVAEPEPEPVREVGPSGYEYQRHGQASVGQYLDGRRVLVTVSTDCAGIPPADRALVARLLGEGA